jgi:hypothetical protein
MMMPKLLQGPQHAELWPPHSRHGNHSSDHNVDLPDVRAAHEETTMIFRDMARDVAAQLSETPEWRMDVSDESGKSLFRLRLFTEPLE